MSDANVNEPISQPEIISISAEDRQQEAQTILADHNAYVTGLIEKINADPKYRASPGNVALWRTGALSALCYPEQYAPDPVTLCEQLVILADALRNAYMMVQHAQSSNHALTEKLQKANDASLAIVRALSRAENGESPLHSALMKPAFIPAAPMRNGRNGK